MKQTLTARVGAPGFGKTERRDAWWLEPSLIAVGLLIFVVYSTWAAFQPTNYRFGPYLSPFFSPYIRPGWWPANWSTAFFVLWVPGGFRATCYYYRRAYWRSLFASPAACAVSEPKHDYTGETGPVARLLPILHRWFLYLSIIVLIWLWADVIKAFDFDGHFGIGLGTLVMLINVLLLSSFTLGCHALRSLAGGNARCFSCSPGGKVRYGMWGLVSRLTERHKLWAWLSLFSVGLTDLYIRLCAMGMLHDHRFL